MTEFEPPPEQALAVQIDQLRVAAARSRRLAKATGDRELSDTLVALAADYEAHIAAIFDKQASGHNSDSACG